MSLEKAENSVDNYYGAFVKQELDEEIDENSIMGNDTGFISETESISELVINETYSENDEDPNYQNFDQELKLESKLEPQEIENDSKELTMEPEDNPEQKTTVANDFEAAPTFDPKSWLNYNFVHKLHFLAGSEEIKFINWSASDNELLQLDYVGLQDHLLSGQSMFRSRSIAQFVNQLKEVGFERLQRDSELKMYFEHKHFKPNKQKSLTRIPTPYFESVEEEQKQDIFVKDPCTMFYGTISKLQLARSRFQTLLSYHNGLRLMQEQESEVEEQSSRRGRYVASAKRVIAKPKLTPALQELYVSPQDSADIIEVDHVPDYAGFYGNVNPAMIQEFFGEYLPRYTTRLGTNQTDIIVDVSKLNAFQQNLPIGIVLSEDEDEPNKEDETIDANSTATTETTDLLGKEDESQLPIEIGEPPETAALPNDIELEQMMNDLWGDSEMKQDNPVTKKARTTLGTIEHSNIETKPVGESHYFNSAAEIAAVLQGEPSNIEPAEKPIEKVSQRKKKKNRESRQPDEENVTPKKRRYDLRNSKKRQTL